VIEPEVLADRLQELAARLRSEGGLTGERFAAWQKAVMPRLFESDDDAQEAAVRESRSERDDENRRGDAQAARYLSEWTAVLDRVGSDTARMDALMTVANPPQPRRLAQRDMQPAQLAAEGLCVSCWKAEIRDEDTDSVRYRDRCRFCGDWRGEHGEDPPGWLLRKRQIHGKRSVTTADVAKALGKAS
jgi:hypothetical protein